MIRALLLALLPCLCWAQGAENRVRVRFSTTALADVELAVRDSLPTPGITARAAVASPTRAPWIVANGWRFTRHPEVRYRYDLPGGKATLAAAEAFAYGADAMLKIDPADATSLINIAADHQDHGRYREAVGLYQKALASTNDPGLRSLAYRNLGNLYLESGDLPQAAANYREDLALHPDDAEAKVGLARAERMQPEATGPDLSRN